MDEKLYEEILDVFMPSDEMKAHLMKQKLDNKTIIALILGSIKSLHTKLEWLKRLYDVGPSDYLDEVIGDITEALAYLEKGSDGIFTVLEKTFSETFRAEKTILACPAKDRFHIENSILVSDDESFPWQFPAWWEAEEWNLESGYLGKYQFLYAKEENHWCHVPVFFRKIGPHYDGRYAFRYSGEGEEHLDLSLPFKVGDILTVWGLPFENPVECLLLCKEPGNQLALAHYYDGTERIINFASGKSWLQGLHSFGVSAYYRMGTSDCSHLSEDQLKRFLEVKEAIHESGELGKLFAENKKRVGESYDSDETL